MLVKILKTDKRLGVTEGEIYSARRYQLDPTEKVTLIARDPDGYDPECNMYIEGDIALWLAGNWMVVEDGRYVPMDEVKNG